MSNYKITFGGNSYNLSDLINTTGSSITPLYVNFPTSTTPTCNFQKLANNINYLENNTDLSNKCSARSQSSNANFSFTVPAGFNKISGILASGGGGGGGGGPTGNADLGNNNDSGGGGGGGGSGAIVVLKNYPVSAGNNIVVNVGAFGERAPTTNTNSAASGFSGGTTNLSIGGTQVLSIGGGGGGSGGGAGNANFVGAGGAGGAGGTINISNIDSFVSKYSGNTGTGGNNAIKGTPGKGGNGGNGINVNNQTGNINVYIPYTSVGGIGPNQTGDLSGEIGGNAAVATATVFSAGGGGASGSGQGITDSSAAGGRGSGGFAIIYLYF